MEIRKIKQEELIMVQQVSSLAFNFTLDIKDPKEHIHKIVHQPEDKWSSCWKNHWGAFTEDGILTSSLSIMDYQVFFDGTVQEMKGIGNVCSYPHYRRQGTIREIFRSMLSQMYQEKVAFSYLYPFSEEFYSKFGYHRSSPKKKWSFALSKIPTNSYHGNFSLYQGEDNISDFKTAYLSYAKNINMMVDRDDFDWDTLKKANPFKTNTQAFVYRNEDQVPSGYFIFHKEFCEGSTVFSCNEIAFDGFETLKAILTFIKTFSSDYHYVEFYTPECYKLDYFCSDYPASNQKSALSIEPTGMARVVNTEQVLLNACYKGDGDLTLALTDDFLPANSGIYEIKFQNGKAYSVLRSSGNAADIEMRIQEFSAAILGNYSVTDFNFMDHIQLNCSPKKADKVFYRKPNWINNAF